YPKLVSHADQITDSGEVCGLEFHRKVIRDATTVAHLDALGLGPLANLVGLRLAVPRSRPTPRLEHTHRCHRRAGVEILCKGTPQLLGMLGTQVNGVLLTIQAE